MNPWSRVPGCALLMGEVRGNCHWLWLGRTTSALLMLAVVSRQLPTVWRRVLLWRCWVRVLAVLLAVLLTPDVLQVLLLVGLQVLLLVGL